MISASFVADVYDFQDSEYDKLDGRIIDAAKLTKGYLGEEAWIDKKTKRTCTVYYWESIEGLQELFNNTDHLEAKGKSGRWLKGYKVIVSEVIASYGTDNYGHPLDGRNFGREVLRRNSDN